jgi:hypothetical protein
MKKALTLPTFVFAMVSASLSFGEWTRVSESESGNVYYVDLDRIKTHSGFFYYWELGDYLKSDKWGYMSVAVYRQGDCKQFRTRGVHATLYKQSMGRGYGDSHIPTISQWIYPPPNTSLEEILKTVCEP